MSMNTLLTAIETKAETLASTTNSAKDLVYLGKTVEAMTPAVTLQDYAPLAGAAFTGNVSIAGTLSGGEYTNLHPQVAAITTVVDFTKPVCTVTLTGSTTFTEANKAEGRTSVVKLVTGGFTPTFSANVKWAKSTIPTWADGSVWIISLMCHNGTTVLASAQPFTL